MKNEIEMSADTVFEINPVTGEDGESLFRCEIFTEDFSPIEPFNVRFENPVHRKEEEDVQLS